MYLSSFTVLVSLLVQYTYVQWKLPVHIHSHSSSVKYSSSYLFYLNGPIKQFVSAICFYRLTVNSMIKDASFLGYDAMVSGK